MGEGKQVRADRLAEAQAAQQENREEIGANEITPDPEEEGGENADTELAPAIDSEVQIPGPNPPPEPNAPPANPELDPNATPNT